jgi:hypothetical protein
MDVRNWEFLANALKNLETIEKELSSSLAGKRIAYTAFFWSLIQYHDSDDEDNYKIGAMSLPDHMTPGNRERIEQIAQELDAWLQTQASDAHPDYEALQKVIAIGLQASSHPVFEAGRRPFRRD